MTPSKWPSPPPELVFWLMIANGSPQMLAIARIKNILETPFRSFMTAPPLCPLIRSCECEFGYGFSARKTFRNGCNLLEAWDSVLRRLFKLWAMELRSRLQTLG